jgi:hypothetical protein
MSSTIALAGFSSVLEFAPGHRLAFLKTLAATAGVSAAQITVGTVSMSGGSDRRQLLSTQIEVGYAINGLTEMASSSAQAALVAVAADPSAFSDTLVTEFSAVGAAVPNGFGVAAVAPKVVVQTMNKLSTCDAVPSFEPVVTAAPTASPTEMPTSTPTLNPTDAPSAPSTAPTPSPTQLPTGNYLGCIDSYLYYYYANSDCGRGGKSR